MTNGILNMPTAARPQLPKKVRNDEQRWQAVTNRNANADGTFVYAVRTTGVYCRPSCAARRAQQKNVEFYPTPADAERAGFRPCKRCRPKDASPANLHAKAITKACKLIVEGGQSANVANLATAAGMSPSHFHRIFKSQTGLTPKEYAAAHRWQRMRGTLPKSNSVTTAIYNAGFNSSGRFYESSTKDLGMKPTTFRTGGKGTTIRFAIGECALGSILVAASQHGVCSIALGNNPAALVNELQDRFPSANLVGGNRHFERLVAQVVAFLEQPALGLHLPLEVIGTAFQHRVWQKLREIPSGTTRTYREIARELGDPHASRAVAGACAANPIAVAIPCHRVVRTDGSLSGYRWGIERKVKLLRAEKSANDMTVSPLPNAAASQRQSRS